MDTVNVKGVNYEKASLLAKEFKYTSDYLGQLCRARKVDCQLIGRTWYINRDSLVNHKSSRYTKSVTPSDEKTFEYNVKINKSRVEVEPILKNRVVKMLDSRSQHHNDKINWSPAKYELDQGELLPTMLDKSKEIRVDVAEIKTIKTENVAITKIQSKDPSPVVLNGNIKISSLDNEYEVEKTILNKKNIAFIREADIKPAIKAENLVKATENKKPLETEVSEFSLIPEKIKQKENKKKGSKMKKWLSFSLIMLLATTLLLSLFIEFKIEVSSQSYDTSFQFSPVTFDELFSEKLSQKLSTFFTDLNQI